MQQFTFDIFMKICACESLSEALILASINPQYLPVQYMKTSSSEHVVYTNCSECKKTKTNNF